MSKTFKNATSSGTEVYVGEGINADSVQLIIRNVGSGIGKAGIYLNSSDIPALALAILEAAGLREGDREKGMMPHSAKAMYLLRLVIEERQRATAEAEAQAKLEAEALELRNAYFDDVGSEREWSDLTTGAQSTWLAVARRAREINKEDNNA